MFHAKSNFCQVVLFISATQNCNNVTKQGMNLSLEVKIIMETVVQ